MGREITLNVGDDPVVALWILPPFEDLVFQVNRLDKDGNEYESIIKADVKEIDEEVDRLVLLWRIPGVGYYISGLDLLEK